MTSKSNFYFREKLVLTQILTGIFEFEFGMQGPIFFPLSMNKTIIIVGALKGIQTVLDICFNILE